MKIIVYGSHLCPDTLYALNRLMEKGMKIDFINISASLADLKKFLCIYENEDVYLKIRKESNLGIPCFQFEDGGITLDLNEALSKEV